MSNIIAHHIKNSAADMIRNFIISTLPSWLIMLLNVAIERIYNQDSWGRAARTGIILPEKQSSFELQVQILLLLFSRLNIDKTLKWSDLSILYLLCLR